jgi:NADH:ubiquinone oxidoreductase subunit K
MSIELMLNAANINFVAFSRSVSPGELTGQIFAIFVMAIAAGEAAVGLAIVIALYRRRSNITVDEVNVLKW